MTQGDKWKRRVPVLNYRAFCDEVRLRNVRLPEPYYHAVFLLPVPGSWSRKRKGEMNLTPHRQRPDLSNLNKALEDACEIEDSWIADSRQTKLWIWDLHGWILIGDQPIDVSRDGIERHLDRWIGDEITSWRGAAR